MAGPREPRGRAPSPRREPERRGDARPRAGDASGPRAVRKVRTEHGTRVARSITCSSCGAKDTIHFAPRDPASAMCRRCAADLLGVEDPDTRVASEKPLECSACHRIEMTRFRPENLAEFLCRDCARGIESKQEDKVKGATRVSKKVVRVRRGEDGR